MKYIKKFEMIEDSPKVGDYVLMNISYDKNSDFYLNYPGKIIKFFTIGKYRQGVNISYGDNIPDNMTEILGYTKKHGYYKNFQYKEIYAFSKNKEDLKIKISANKFNI